jgi:hypothetical protein
MFESPLAPQHELLLKACKSKYAHGCVGERVCEWVLQESSHPGQFCLPEPWPVGSQVEATAMWVLRAVPPPPPAHRSSKADVVGSTSLASTAKV